VRIVIDARPALDPRKTGVGHYTSQLIRHLPAAMSDDDVIAWYLHAKGVLRPRTFFAGVGAANLSERATRFPARVFGPLSSRLGVPRLESFVDFDVVLATNFVPPATRSTGVVPVVHDLAFRLFPETAPHMDGRWIRRFETTLRRAARIITPSASARDDLVRLFDVEDSRVDVVHHGVDADAFRRAPRPVVADVRRRFGIDGPYALFVGGIEPRKNLVHLVRAVAALDDVRLVIAGGAVRWFPEAVEALERAIGSLPPGARGRIVRTGYVSEPDKVALLSDATCLAYPSTYEGFGFPVLEAFAADLPVLTSNTSSLPEVAGNAAVMVDPTEPDAIAAGLRQLFDDEDLRALLRAAGHARVARFTWEATARATAASLTRTFAQARR
jgi:glycosyltransferase involved in cell wall biosynthesis